MSHPKVSVVVPTYNNARYLPEAIQSVLEQTYPDFELVIVDDGSTDNTPEVVRLFQDSRIKYLAQENRGVAAARNTGIQAAAGEIVALLDGDDKFHPEKLKAHLDLLEKHPEVAATYNSRFELNHSASTIRELVRPPLVVGLADLVLGFPFAPSDLVLRKEAALGAGLWNENFVFFGEDLDMNCRLALAGYRFARVDRSLSYRRHHSGRVIKDLTGGLQVTFHILDRVFADPRCPANVRLLRDRTFMNKYLGWACFAFAQGELTLGQTWIREAVRLAPELLGGKPNGIVSALMDFAIADDSIDHAAFLKGVFEPLSSEWATLADQYAWAVARGYLLKGTRAVMWDRLEEGRAYFAQAARLGAEIDGSFLHSLAYQLTSYEIEFGASAARSVLRKLEPYLKRLGNGHCVRRLKGYYSINGAFEDYRIGKYANVPIKLIDAVASDPRYLANRGVLSILFRSLGAGLGSATVTTRHSTPKKSLVA